MWYVCVVLYAVLYVRVRCFVECECAVSRMYIYIFNCDVYLDHLKVLCCVYLWLVLLLYVFRAYGRNGVTPIF